MANEQLRDNVNIPAAASQSSPDNADAIQSAINQKNLLMGKATEDMPGAFGMGILGGAAGAQASQGITNPFAAAIQGIAAGMQVNAAIWQQKRAEMKNALDAAPAIQTMPDIVNKPGYEIFKGLPTKIVQEALAAIGTDAIRLHTQAQAKETEDTIDETSAKAYANLAAKAGFNISPADITGARKQDVADFVKYAVASKGKEEKYDEAGEKQQDALEQQARNLMSKVVSNRSGGLGLQDAKVNQAIHLRNLLDQYYDPNTRQYNVPASQYEELAIGLANLVSGSSVATESMINGIRQRTAKGDINGAIAYITGTTPSGSTQDVFKNLADSIDRQGLTSEKLRDKYLDDMQKLFPTRLDATRKRMLSAEIGNSYRQTLNESPAGPKAMNPGYVIRQVNGKSYKFDPITKQNLGAI